MVEEDVVTFSIEIPPLWTPSQEEDPCFSKGQKS